MIRSGMLAAMVLAAAPVYAEGALPLAPLVPDAKPAARLGWAGLGFYDVRFSTQFGTFTDAEFGLNAGAAAAITQLSPEVSLMGFGNVAISFASGGQFFPLTAGVAARFDKLPVQVLAGVGATLMINTTSADTGVGVGFMLMGIYPLVQVDPRLSAIAQLQYHLLSNSLSLFNGTLGAGYSF